MDLENILPVSLECAVITQLITKNNLDSLVFNNYRLISNLLFLIKNVKHFITSN